MRDASTYDTGTVADTSQPADLGAHGRAHDAGARHAGRAENAFGSPALIQQLLGQRLSDELGMALGAGENDALLVGHTCDPLRLETLTFQQALEPRGVERHAQAVANDISLKDRHPDVDNGLAGDDAHEQVGDLPFLGIEHPLRRLGVRGRRQRGADGAPRVEQLLIGAVDHQDSRSVAPERATGLLAEGCKITTRKGSGCRQRFQSDHRPVELTVDVACEILRHLQGAPFDLLLLETRHAVEGENRECEEGQRQGEREQDQERPDSLGWNAIAEQARWHEDVAGDREIPIGRDRRSLGSLQGAENPTAPATYREKVALPAF